MFINLNEEGKGIKVRVNLLLCLRFKSIRTSRFITEITERILMKCGTECCKRTKFWFLSFQCTSKAEIELRILVLLVERTSITEIEILILVHLVPVYQYRSN